MSSRPTAVIPDRARSFPTLTAVQVERIAAHGRLRTVRAGELLVEQGDPKASFFVVKTALLEAVRPSVAGETVIVTLGPGQFNGESNMISGRRSVVRLRA